mmetsp:Transcript_13364/g.22738  ORF Transcript_13364/g.22738 Transcript_13364/m.22738 type:complete len:113 (+) Transcript_13364:4311-4649(+)
MFLEKEVVRLIELEQECEVVDQETDPQKRLNYYFYELIYDWADKKSFFAIKDQFPAYEEGLILNAVKSVGNMCASFRRMALLIGDIALAERIENAAKLLDREIMTTQSLYYL